MKSKWIFISALLVFCLLALPAGLGQAQEPPPEGEVQPEEAPEEESRPQGDVSIQALMGTAFTYQGQLKKDDGPVNGNCDLQFSLWDAAGSGSPPSGGTQIGATQTRSNVSLTNGLFTVPLNFGSTAFTGDARWLQITVRCPAGSGSYTALSPRQSLTPAPYALALPGLWTQQNSISPSLVGGYSGNSATSGVYGAAIGGGGAQSHINSVTDDYGTVGGGYENQAGNGAGTLSDSAGATVGGGYVNTASGSCATVSGGYGNTASGARATVGGGAGNTASGNYTTVGGVDNTASGYATTVWGSRNSASDQYSTVPGGYYASASHYGEMAHASGRFAATGDAQASLYVLRRTSTGTAYTELFLDGSGHRITIPDNRAMAFEILVVGHDNTDNQAAGYRFWGIIKNVGGTVSFVESVDKSQKDDDDSWDARVQADDTNDALVIEVRGNNETVRWVATVRTSEVSW